MTSHKVTRAVNIKSVLFSLWGDYFSTCSSFVIEPFPGQRGSGYESDPASLRPAESSWLTRLVSLLNPFVHTATQRKCQHWHTYAVTKSFACDQRDSLSVSHLFLGHNNELSVCVSLIRPKWRDGNWADNVPVQDEVGRETSLPDVLGRKRKQLLFALHPVWLASP